MGKKKLGGGRRLRAKVKIFIKFAVGLLPVYALAGMSFIAYEDIGNLAYMFLVLAVAGGALDFVELRQNLDIYRRTEALYREASKSLADYVWGQNLDDDSFL